MRGPSPRSVALVSAALLLLSCGSEESLIVEEATEPEVVVVEQEPPPEPKPGPTPVPISINDLNTNEGEDWRPRDFNFLAQCDDAGVDDRLPPAIWWEEFEDTRDKVLATGPELQDIESHTQFWESWCPPSGWEDAHTILLVGLYYMEDAYYFADRYEDTELSEYQSRSKFAHSESERYIEDGIRDAIPWYSEMPVFDEGDPRVEVCLAGGLPDTYWMPLCDYYEGPVRNPNSTHYNPNHPTVSEWIQSEREWEQQQKGS